MTHTTIDSILKAMNLSKYQKHNDFHILKFKDHLEELPMKTDGQKCDFFRIVITKEHNVDVIVDNTSFSAIDNSITFLAPLQMLSTTVKSIEHLGEGYMLLFDKSFLRLGYSNYEVLQKFPFFNSNHSPVYFLKENNDLFFDLMKNMYKLFQEFNDENLEIIRSYITILLFEGRKSFLGGEIKPRSFTRYNEIALCYENVIKETKNKRVPLEFYADKLNVSAVYLAECVKKATGKTAKHVLNEYIILESTSLLLQSTKTIDNIADQVGYTSTSNFTLFFKKHTGLTPTGYRKKHK